MQILWYISISRNMAVQHFPCGSSGDEMIDRFKYCVLSQTWKDPVQQEVWSRPDPLHTWGYTDSGLQLQQTGW